MDPWLCFRHLTMRTTRLQDSYHSNKAGLQLKLNTKKKKEKKENYNWLQLLYTRRKCALFDLF